MSPISLRGLNLPNNPLPAPLSSSLDILIKVLGLEFFSSLLALTKVEVARLVSDEKYAEDDDKVEAKRTVDNSFIVTTRTKVTFLPVLGALLVNSREDFRDREVCRLTQPAEIDRIVATGILHALIYLTCHKGRGGET